MIANHVLTGINQFDVNNEIRFLVASTRVDGQALMGLTFSTEYPDKQKQYAVRVLRALKKEGIIEFFVLTDDLNDDSTESEFLVNKYAEYINTEMQGIYVKL